MVELSTTTDSRQVTVTAPANIAFIKYWGARDLERAIPNNPSISMTLERCSSRCALELRTGRGEDEVSLRAADGSTAAAPPAFRERAVRHLERLRRLAGREVHFRMVTRNSFPAAAGLASSASGFAALTLAAARCLELDESPESLSRLARLSGSGSAARSVLGGFVEWPVSGGEGSDGEPGYHAGQIATAEHWDLRDVIALVETRPKRVSSLEGHRLAPTSPYYQTRLERLPARLELVRRAIAERDLAALGPVLEEDAIDLHLIAMSSRPPIFYWQPATLAVLAAVRRLRDDRLEAYSTMDAGANVHVICAAENEAEVATRLERVEGVSTVIRDRVGAGPSLEPGLQL